eukprot:911020_1
MDSLLIDTIDKSLKRIDDMSPLQREVSEGTHHYLEETADNQLIEDIRDIISDIQETSARTWHTNDDTINQYLYRHYKIMNNKHHQNRIDYVLSEIDKQDIKKTSTQLPMEDTSKTRKNSRVIDDPLAPSKYKAKQEELRTSKAYIHIKDEFERKMMKLLQKKNKDDLYTEFECSMESRPECTANNIMIDCEPLKRIDVILSAFHSLMQEEQLWGKLPLAPLLTIDNIFGHQQMFDDFSHIKLYNMDSQSHQHAGNIATDADTKSTQVPQKLTDKEWIFQEECDKIHRYFLHSTIQFGETSTEEAKANRTEKHEAGRRWSSKEHNGHNKTATAVYVGMKEDKEWFKRFSKDMSPDEEYKLLVEHMGIFRWQSSHGFRTGQNRGIMHDLKPKFSNFKEEALHKEYYAAKDNWNQTLRKSKQFHQSFGRQRIRTPSTGSFHDEVSNTHFVLPANKVITSSDVIILKLYTDFDKLQHELTRCFRWESIIGFRDEDLKTDEDKLKSKELENRLRQFFYWRTALLTVLTKFGVMMNEKHSVLYHGVNAKMRLNSAETMALSVPLSTTSSYHVAKTFATAKGMVLEITSQFPRLKFCSAFDASLISDYPEESEYLVSFMYLRVLKVMTRPIVSDVSKHELWKAAPLESKTRVLFFSIHLFKEQMFSMSTHLEYYLVQFLKCNRMEC